MVKLSSSKNKVRLILSKEVIILIFCSIFTLAIPLTYQMFLGQGSDEYFRMYFIVMLPAGILTYLIMIVNHSLLVVLPKNKSLFSSAFTLALSLNIILLFIFFSMQDLFLKIYEIDYPLAYIYYKITIISVSIMSINSILNYYLIFRGKISIVLKVNVLTFFVTFIGNTFCILWFDSEKRMIGYGMVKILAAILTLAYFFYYIKPLVRIKLISPFNYLKRTYKILFGDVLSLLVILISPSLVNFILVKYQYNDYIPILGVSKTIITFISIPSGMLIIHATTILSKYNNDYFKFNRLLDRVKHLVWKLNIYPASVILLFFIIFLKQLWHLDFYPAGMFLMITGLSFLPVCLEVPYVIINRVFEKQINLARIIFYIQMTSLGLLFILSHFSFLNLYFYSLIILFLSTIKFLLVRFEAKKV